jgi:O-succinylbenzoate synthase
LRVERVVVREIEMRLLAPFETSFGREDLRRLLIVEAEGGGISGFAECCALSGPLYNEETVGTCWHMLRDFLVPAVLGREFQHPSEVEGWFAHIRRNHIARSAIESAVWDLYAQAAGTPLYRVLGGDRTRIDVGVSVGIHPDLPSLCRTVEGFLRDGYRKVKVKIKPGYDVAVIGELRRQFGDVPLMADANSAYRLADAETLRRLDEFGLMMIEQPLGHDDIVDHAALQRQLRTPVCLDESIHHAEDARRAIAIGACRIVNIKIARVGGLAAARAVHDVCRAAGVPVWCGGMLETGIGRAHNIAIATLPGFTLPGDTSASSRYWAEDIVDPAVSMEPDGTIIVPQRPGRGYEVVRARLDARTLRSEALRV